MATETLAHEKINKKEQGSSVQLLEPLAVFITQRERVELLSPLQEH